MRNVTYENEHTGTSISLHNKSISVYYMDYLHFVRAMMRLMR